jgi:hypothetical protein
VTNTVLLLSIFFSFSIFSYEKPIQYLLNKDYKNLLTSSYITIQKSTSKEEIKELLLLLDDYSSELFKPNDFHAEVVPFNDGQCLKTQNKLNKCHEHRSHEYYLKQKGLQQELVINQGLLTYTTSRKTLNKSSRINFGKALHLIMPPKSKDSKQDNYYLLVREIESTKENQVLNQNINLFRVTRSGEKQTCKLAEFDITADEKDYRIITTYAKLLAPLQGCEQKFISF